MKKAIGYVRVSTEEQSQDTKFGVRSQQEAILSYAQENGYEIIYWSIDIISGAKDNRTELDKILYDNAELPFHEAVIVYKNDRVARDTKLYFYYFYTLEKRKIKLLSCEEHYSEGDDFANVYRSLLMFVAEQERKNIALRTSKGRSIKARCGGYAGGRIPYGYRSVEGNLEICLKERNLVVFIFRQHKKGKTYSDIFSDLVELGYRTRKNKVFQISSIRKIISNKKFYQGYYKWGEMDWVKGVHKPILSEDF